MSGQLDILDGVGDYDVVSRRAIAIDVLGYRYRGVDLDGLIAAKEAWGRPKDLQASVELKAIRARRGR